jgi:DNA-binding NtrC family response regulator
MSAGDPLYVLKVLSEDGALVRRFPLAAGEHVVGSGPDVDIVLEPTGVSRRHASIRVLADGGAVVSDLASKNGTRLAGRPVREAAVDQFAIVSFGPVQAALHPADASREKILLPPQDGGKTERAGLNRRAPSTEGLDPLERLAGTLEEELPALAAGLSTPAETASALVQRWSGVLPLGRVEILRDSPAGEVVVAAASTAGLFPKATAGLDVEGPDGWKVRLRAPAAVPLPSLAPLLRLVLGLLAARSRRRPAGLSAIETGRNESPASPIPPPAGLGAETSRLYRAAGKVARGDVPVLILGESGVGKEVLSRWIHARSRRASGPFLALNCAALPRDLLEAELFGIERGVATGVEARPGLLERAGGGTVFLDEIGDMAPETQAKVLRVLESTSLYRVGGRVPMPVDVRFVAATNRDLEALVEEGGFRRDLFHRLAAFQVTLPPLRERREEIPGLAARFFHRELERNGVSSPGITRTALGALVRHAWPGNVRELQNEIAKAVLLLEPGEPLDVQHLSERVRVLARAEQGARPPLLTLDEAVRRAEREAFSVALASSGGDAACAMEILGVSRTTWYRKLKDLGLTEPDETDPDPGTDSAADSHRRPGNGTGKSDKLLM